MHSTEMKGQVYFKKGNCIRNVLNEIIKMVRLMKKRPVVWMEKGLDFF